MCANNHNWRRLHEARGHRRSNVIFKIFQPDIVEDICKSLLEQDSYMFIKVRYQSNIQNSVYVSHLN